MKRIRRVFALVVALCLVLTLVPTEVGIAQVTENPGDIVEIISVSPLATEIATQEIALGDKATLPTLPTDISATVQTTTHNQNEDGLWQTSSSEEVKELAVTYALAEGSTFATTEPAQFIYTATLVDNTLKLADGVLIPQITVNIIKTEQQQNASQPDSKKEISVFIEPEVIEIANADIRTEEEIIATFPAFVLATVDGAEKLEVPVSEWTRVFPTAETAYTSATAGEYYYLPTIDTTIYTIADTATMPNQIIKVGEVVHTPQPLADTAQSFSFQVTVKDDGDASTTGDLDFSIPLSGGSGTDTNINNNYGKPYNWSIDWDGDGTVDQTISSGDEGAPENTSASDGIPHTYEEAGTYTIIITNNALTNDAWLAAFGFRSYTNGASANANKQKIVAINSAITPEMTRTSDQIENGTAVHYEWAYTFYSCSNLESIGDGFTSGWDDITTIGNAFANFMFYDCSKLTGMGNVFNMPQSPVLESIGDDFAYYMFYGCSELTSMGSVFNLPQSPVLESIGEDFASRMFSGCSKLTGMGSAFDLPQSDALTTIGDYFAAYMFYDCSELTSMGNVFNLPQSDALTTIGDNFASNMFNGCSELTSMGSVFNMPQSPVLESIGDYFAAYMFNGCSKLISMGSAFTMPQSDALTKIGDDFAYSMFEGCSTLESMGSAFTMPQSDALTTIGDYFAAYMFYGCSKLTGMGSAFNLPQSDALTTIGNYFAANMFYGCSKLTGMGSVFTMPQSPVLESIGNDFASEMFDGCSELTSMGIAFTMPQSSVLESIGNDFTSEMFNGCSELTSMGIVFNLPQSSVLETIGNDFASEMFNGCSELTSMGIVFNLPQSSVLETIGNNFAYNMFYGCSELISIENSFNMPQSPVLTEIGNDFAAYMFYGCEKLTSMGNSFNMPQSDALTTIGNSFAAYMFNHAGSDLVINEVFRFPKLTQDQANNNNMFLYVFNNADLADNQSRSAQSIINENPTPNSVRYTFNGQSDAFFDWNIVPTNFGGGGGTADRTVTFNNNTIQGITPTFMPPAQGVVGNQPTGKPATPTATNYTFVGWYTDSALTNEYDFTQNVTGNLDLYAKFEGNKYTLSFDKAGGTGTADDLTVTYSSQIGILPTPTKTGYTFNGWTVDGNNITSTTVWNYTENKTAVAQWTVNTYTLSFDKASGDGTAANMTVTYDAQIGDLPTLTKTGYTFDGWKVDGNKITSTTVWSYAENKTAVAQWTIDSVENAKDAIDAIPDISKIDPDDSVAKQQAKDKVDEAIKQVEALTDEQLEELEAQNPGIIDKLEDSYRDINYLLNGTLEIMDIRIGVSASGIMSLDENGNPIPVKLEVTQIPDPTDLASEVTEGFTGTPDIVLSFDVKLTANGQEIQPNGEVKVTFEAPGYEGKTLTVGHKKSSGQWEYFIVTVGADSMFSITVTELSPFLVLANPELIPTGVSFDKTSISLQVGQTATITATVSPITAIGDVAWISSNPAVATVDANGVVTAVSNGTATITMSIGNVSASATVTVSIPVSPETGDNTNLALWAMVALVSASGIAVLMRKMFAK